MKRNIRNVKKLTALFLVFAMSIVGIPVSAGQNDDLPHRVNSVTDTPKGQGMEYENEANVLEKKEYEEFGFSMSSPKEFDPDDKSNPLEGYESIPLSELYVGMMNGPDDDHFEGNFKILEDTKEISEDAFDFDIMDNKTVGTPYDYSENYPDNGDDVETQSSNAVAADYDGDGVDELIESTIYVDYNYAYEPIERSMIDIHSYKYDKSSNKWKGSRIGFNSLADIQSNDITFVADIDADTAKCYTSLAAGDYDNDGKDEVAVYIPSRTLVGPMVNIYDYNGSSFQCSKCFYIYDMGDEYNNFRYNSKETYVPVVSLATTSISGEDDLVIIANNPRTKDYGCNSNGQDSIMGIYHIEGYKMVEKMKPMELTFTRENNSKVRMRFCSVTDTDLNGNGIAEMLIGGYLNDGWTSHTDIGEISDEKNLIQVMCWNDDADKYEMVWTEPREVEANSDYDVSNEMLEPAALASVRFAASSLCEKVFLEGVLHDFAGDINAASEAEKLRPGSFSFIKETDTHGGQNDFVSQAYAAVFSSSGCGAEQLVIVQGDHRLVNYDDVNYDICWTWYDGVKKEYVSKVTNNDYIESDLDDNGTFLSICPLNCDNDTIKYEYQGKRYGWSAPTLYSILQSPPYWSELQYNTETYGAGEISYEISVGKGSGHAEEFGVGLGSRLSVSFVAGLGLVGSDAMAGGGVAFSSMLKYVNTYTESTEITEKQNITLVPGNDYAIAMAVPTVSYLYNMWVPTYTVTQEDIDHYNEVKQNNPEADAYPYTVGTVVEGHVEQVVIDDTLDPTFTHLTVDNYNELAKKHGLKQIDKSILGNKTNGDPSTYLKSEEELNKVLHDVEDLFVSKSVTVIGGNNGDGSQEIGYEINNSTEQDHTISFELDAEAFFKMVDSVSIGAAYQFDLEAGIGLEFDKAGTDITTNSKGTAFSAKVIDLPSGVSSTYGYTTKLYVAHMKEDDASMPGAYIAGFLVTEPEENKAPPAIPGDFRVVGTTTNEVVLKWTKPDYREVGYYEIYKHNENDKENLDEKIGETDKNYFVVTNLMPGRTYQFTMKTYSGTTSSENSSVISRPISATTKKNFMSPPYFEQQPRNVIIPTGGYGTQYSLDAIAKMGEGKEEAGYTLSYQWQKYDEAQLTKDGHWVDIKGATDSTYNLPIVTEDNASSFPAEEYYRVKATQQSGGDIVSVISKAATVYIEKENTGYTYHNTKTHLSVSGNSPVYKVNDTSYYMEEGSSATFEVNIETIVDTYLVPNSGDVVLVYSKEGDESNKTLVPGTLTDGYVSFNLDESKLKLGDYVLSAIYAGGLDGSDDTLNYYLASQSDEIILHVVNTYNVNYNLDGGINSPYNPEMLTNESKPVVLKDAEKAGYSFAGWYLDEELTEPLEDSTLDINDFNSDIELYAKWSPLSYNITYELNGGVNHPDNPTSYKAEETVSLKDATYAGYDFEGWYEKDDFSGDRVKTIKGTECRDITLYAKWKESESPFPQDADGSYMISSYEDLVNMAQRIQSNPAKYASATYVQTKHITCIGSDWNLAIGTDASPFEGTYEGNNYYIVGLRPTGEVNGLFGVIGESGTVKNLSVVDMDFANTLDIVGGIVGVNKGIIDGCGSGVNISGAAMIEIDGKDTSLAELCSDINGVMVGGIVGKNEGTIRNCHSNAELIGAVVGGIAGENTGSIFNVYNTGEVNASEAAGGIVGTNKADGSIRFGYNAAVITGKVAGAVAGTSENTSIKDMYYRSDVSIACGNKTDSKLTVTKMGKSDMRKALFEDTLNSSIANEGGRLKLKKWTWSSSKNGGYPRLSQECVEERMLINEMYGITVTGNIHEDALLQVIKLSEKDENYQTLKSNLKDGVLGEGWQLALVYSDGTYSTFDGKLTISLQLDKARLSGTHKIVHLDEDGKYSPLEIESDGETLTVEAYSLGTFAVADIEKEGQVTEPEENKPEENKDKDKDESGKEDTDKDDKDKNDSDKDDKDKDDKDKDDSDKNTPDNDITDGADTSDETPIWIFVYTMLISAGLIILSKVKVKHNGR